MQHSSGDSLLTAAKSEMTDCHAPYRSTPQSAPRNMLPRPGNGDYSEFALATAATPCDCSLAGSQGKPSGFAQVETVWLAADPLPWTTLKEWS